MQCKFCKKTLSSKSALHAHQKYTQYCLRIQGKSVKGQFQCKICKKTFVRKSVMENHSCNRSTIQKLLEQSQKRVVETEKENQFLTTQLESTLAQLKDLQERYDKLSMAAVKRPTTETIIEIEPEMSSSEEPDSDSENEETKYELVPLNVGKDFQIEYREKDGYIDVTNLCRAGGKKINDWKRLNKTEAFFQALSSTTGIPVVELIQMETGGNGKRHTWVHPLVAINIAQWISPRFDVKVSGWVYEAMMTGKVDITNTTSYKRLVEENKGQKFQIKHLTKKYVRRQTRKVIKERNVIYILTTKLMKKDRRYIMGKATNLTNRLSTYNKSDEHQVVYYQKCNDERQMNITEQLVFQKLESHREQANRERFILPIDKDSTFFIDVVKQCIAFVQN